MRWTGGGSAGLFFFNTLVASFVILILFEPLKAKVEERVLALFFAERFQLVQALQTLRTRVASVVDVRQLGQVMLDGIYETRRVTHASLYLLSDDGLGYRRLDHRGPAPAPYIDAAANHRARFPRICRTTFAMTLHNPSGSGWSAICATSTPSPRSDSRQWNVSPRTPHPCCGFARPASV